MASEDNAATAAQPASAFEQRRRQVHRGLQRVGDQAFLLGALQRGLGKLSANPERLAADLEASWEVLAEAVQTVMRRHGLPNPYEQLKALTRGHGITEASLREFIAGLELPQEAKQRLLAMTPGSYTGLAGQLARDA